MEANFVQHIKHSPSKELVCILQFQLLDMRVFTSLIHDRPSMEAYRQHTSPVSDILSTFRLQVFPGLWQIFICYLSLLNPSYIGEVLKTGRHLALSSGIKLICLPGTTLQKPGCFLQLSVFSLLLDIAGRSVFLMPLRQEQPDMKDGSQRTE